MNQRQQHRGNGGDQRSDVGNEVEQKGEQAPEHGKVQAKGCGQHADGQAGGQAGKRLDAQVALYAAGESLEVLGLAAGCAHHQAYLGGQRRGLQEHEYHREGNQEEIRQQSLDRIQHYGNQTHRRPGLNEVAQQVDTDVLAQQRSHFRKDLVQPCLVERQAVIESSQRAADERADQGQGADDQDDDEGHRDAGGYAHPLQKAGDGRTKNRNEYSHQQRDQDGPSGLHPVDDRDDRNDRDCDGESRPGLTLGFDDVVLPIPCANCTRKQPVTKALL